MDPGILPIGLGEAALTSGADRQTPEGRVHGWIRDQLASGRGTDPEAYGVTITGGYVYRGKAFPALVGKYVFADWSRS